jgi:hypothetical protein
MEVTPDRIAKSRTICPNNPITWVSAGVLHNMLGMHAFEGNTAEILGAQKRVNFR